MVLFIIFDDKKVYVNRLFLAKIKKIFDSIIKTSRFLSFSMFSLSFTVDVLLAAMDEDAGVVVRNVDSVGIVDEVVLATIVERNRIDSEGADVVRIGNGIDGQSLCYWCILVGDVDAALLVLCISQLPFQTGMSECVAQDGDTEERGDEGFEVSACRCVLSQTVPKVGAVARKIGLIVER